LLVAVDDAVMVIVALALRAVFVIEVAVIVTWPPTGMAGGAVNTAVLPLEVESGANEKSPQATAGVQFQVTPAALGS
jgi:hypothetical protein